MKKLVTIFLLCGYSIINAQSKDELIINLSNKFCDCISQETGTKTTIWRKCSGKMLKENAKQIDKIVQEFKQTRRNFESELWTTVNRRLSSSCDRYNSLIDESIQNSK